jgi:hypothetical protein
MDGSRAITQVTGSGAGGVSMGGEVAVGTGHTERERD